MQLSVLARRFVFNRKKRVEAVRKLERIAVNCSDLNDLKRIEGKLQFKYIFLFMVQLC